MIVSALFWKLSCSGCQVMEKLRAAILPEVFTVIKVTKSTLEFLRFDAEIENKRNLIHVISKIDQKVSCCHLNVDNVFLFLLAFSYHNYSIRNHFHEISSSV